MTNMLTKAGLTTGLAVATAQEKLDRFAGGGNGRHIYNEAGQHLVAERVHAAKAMSAAQLATEVHQHALATADQFAQEVYTRLETPGRSPECQAYVESVTQQVMTMYREHLSGIVQVGVMNIAQEASKDVIVPREKKGWFR